MLSESPPNAAEENHHHQQHQPSRIVTSISPKSSSSKPLHSSNSSTTNNNNNVNDASPPQFRPSAQFSAAAAAVENTTAAAEHQKISSIAPRQPTVMISSSSSGVVDESGGLLKASALLPPSTSTIGSFCTLEHAEEEDGGATTYCGSSSNQAARHNLLSCAGLTTPVGVQLGDTPLINIIYSHDLPSPDLNTTRKYVAETSAAEKSEPISASTAVPGSASPEDLAPSIALGECHHDQSLCSTVTSNSTAAAAAGSSRPHHVQYSDETPFDSEFLTKIRAAIDKLAHVKAGLIPAAPPAAVAISSAPLPSTARRESFRGRQILKQQPPNAATGASSSSVTAATSEEDDLPNPSLILSPPSIGDSNHLEGSVNLLPSLLANQQQSRRVFASTRSSHQAQQAKDNVEIDEVFDAFLKSNTTPAEARLEQVVSIAKELFHVCETLETYVQRVLLQDSRHVVPAAAAAAPPSSASRTALGAHDLAMSLASAAAPLSGTYLHEATSGDWGSVSAGGLQSGGDQPFGTFTFGTSLLLQQPPQQVMQPPREPRGTIAPIQIRKASLGVGNAFGPPSSRNHLNVGASGLSPMTLPLGATNALLDFLSPSSRRQARSPGGHILNMFSGNDDQDDMASVMGLHATVNEAELARSHRAQFREDGGFEMINDYMILEELGRGATGAVFLAIHQVSDEPVAIKTMIKKRQRRLQQRTSFDLESVSPSHQQQLAVAASGAGSWSVKDAPLAAAPKNLEIEQEINIMRRLNHPNLIKLHEVIDDDEEQQIHLVMDFCRGGPLIRVVSATGGPLGGRRGSMTTPKSASSSRLETTVVRPLSKLSKYAEQVCNGLRYLHKLNIVHRDIKPDNILIGYDDVVKITDFGESIIAAKLDLELDPTLSAADGAKRQRNAVKTAGTPMFFAPEMCRTDPQSGSTTPADFPLQLEFCSSSGKEADVWAFGVTLYAALVGCFPFYGCTLEEQCRAIVRDELRFPPLAALPEATDITEDVYALWQDAIRTMLNKAPRERLSLKELSIHPCIVGASNASAEEMRRVQRRQQLHIQKQLQTTPMRDQALAPQATLHRKLSNTTQQQRGRRPMSERRCDSFVRAASVPTNPSKQQHQQEHEVQIVVTSSSGLCETTLERGGVHDLQDDNVLAGTSFGSSSSEGSAQAPAVCPSPPKGGRPLGSTTIRSSHQQQPSSSDDADLSPMPRRSTLVKRPSFNGGDTLDSTPLQVRPTCSEESTISDRQMESEEDEDEDLATLREQIFGNPATSTSACFPSSSSGGGGGRLMAGGPVSPVSCRNAARIVFVSEQKRRAVMHHANQLGVAGSTEIMDASTVMGESRRQSLLIKRGGGGE